MYRRARLLYSIALLIFTLLRPFAVHGQCSADPIYRNLPQIKLNAISIKDNSLHGTLSAALPEKASLQLCVDRKKLASPLPLVLADKSFVIQIPADLKALAVVTIQVIDNSPADGPHYGQESNPITVTDSCEKSVQAGSKSFAAPSLTTDSTGQTIGSGKTDIADAEKNIRICVNDVPSSIAILKTDSTGAYTLPPHEASKHR